jgi:NAD-dependent DNA ligase
MYNAGYTSIKSIIEITTEEMTFIPGFQNKAQLLKDIKDKINSTSCVRLMDASNSFGQGFGEKKLQLILDAISVFKSDVTVEQLIQVKGVSTVTAKKFIIGLKAFKEFLKSTGLSSICEKKTKKIPKKTGQKYSGQVVVFTGFRNKQWEETIVEQGGTIGATVTAKTTLLVAKDTLTGKAIKAQEKGIMIVSMEDFVI